MSFDPSRGDLVLTDTTGAHLRFAGFGAGASAGQLISMTAPGGAVTSVVSRTTDGQPVEVQRSSTSNGVTTTESYRYSYNAGLVAGVTLQRQVGGGAWQTVRQVQYAYYDGVEANGNAGDLKTAVVMDGLGNELDSSYYRYYVAGEAGGYQHGLKSVFGPESFARLQTAFADPFSASDADVASYADSHFAYDALQRVTQVDRQGEGRYSYAYTTSTFADGYNSWRFKTVVTLPDGNEDVIYTNDVGEVLLQVYHDTASNLIWATYYRYDDAGRLILTAQPSAVNGYDETQADLVDDGAGNYPYLNYVSGLIATTSYYTTTTATETTAGGVAGYVFQTAVQQGELGAPVVQSTTDYFTHTAGGTTVNPVADQTVYRNSNGTGAETTRYAYTWFAGTAQMQSETVSLPVVTADENGPGVADTTTTFFDSDGRPIWQKDGDGYLTYTAYDAVTGAVTKQITDVDTTRTGDFQNLPAGWVTPMGGGLHLVILAQVDAQGRPTMVTDPNGNVTYLDYDDPDDEVRIYEGWNATTHVPTGPTEVAREDKANGYSETLTMTAAPHLTNGVPDGTEAISGLQTLSRSYTNEQGQVVATDAYFNLTSLTYSTAMTLGTEGTNYYRTRYGYDERGRQDRVQSPTGTIEREVYDGQGRVVSTWVGTNDTPASGAWSPGNNDGTSNMVQVSATQYDHGGVGDGNVTEVIAYPGGSMAARVTDLGYDWRDRQVATKQGVQGMEEATTHRPIVYQELDNLGEVVAQEQYDGDGVSLSATDGVPDRPSVSLLRARTEISHDEQGRAYRTQTYAVDPSMGAVSANALTTNDWFDHRGNVLKEAQPGGLVSKRTTDGAGRGTVAYTTDGGGDTSWADASNVIGDAVLEQDETQYDADGNAILMTMRQRFHDETATGALGTPTTAPHARVTYEASYYDAANRVTASVDVGTNGGVAWVRPSTVPARSDTVLVSSETYSAAGWVETMTDPRGIVTCMTSDALGRTTQTIQAYTDGIPTNDTNQTVNYTYDGNNNVLTVQAMLPGGAHQTTGYVYGVTTASGSAINSNDELAATQYPDPTTGEPSSSEQETYTVDALGDRLALTDRNGNVHSYGYDVLGRPISDAVTTLGAGVDGSVRRLETGYDTQGNAYLFTSYDAAADGTIVNQVERLFNGLGQLTAEYQAHTGAVDQATPVVRNVYSEMAGGANHSRLLKTLYPNGRILYAGYNAGLDDALSRLSYLADDDGLGRIGQHLEEYAYLGLSTVVQRAHPQTGVELTYIQQTGQPNGDAGDQYTGLDRFGRVVDQRWLNTTTAEVTDEFRYVYDRDSNRLTRENAVDAIFSEGYQYDPLNQLIDFNRGVLSDSNGDGVLDTISTPTHSQDWNLDAVGNWSSVTTDGSTQTRTANAQNEITSISGQTTPGYDANGNMTTDETGRTLIYDAWNHLIQVRSSATVLATYRYDALDRRVVEDDGTPTDLYYSAQWQVLEERQNGQTTMQYVWSPVYVDAMVERDRDTDGNGSLDERFYSQQDANFNTTALVSMTGNVMERYAEDPYGLVTVLAPDWSVLAMSDYAWAYIHQGEWHEVATGLNYSRDRDYSPDLGRWVERDPIELAAGDPNLYRYESSQPVTALDPTGLMVCIQSININDQPGNGMPGLPTGILTNQTSFAYSFKVRVDAKVSGGDTIKKATIKQYIYFLGTAVAANGTFGGAVIRDNGHTNNTTISEKDANAAVEAWKKDTFTYTEDTGINPDYPNQESGKDWVEYVDAPGWLGGPFKRPLPAKGFKSVWMRLAVKVVATGTDGKSVTATFWRSQEAENKAGTWKLSWEQGPVPKLPHTWKKD